MADPIENVTIVGGGTAGWLAALLLQHISGGDTKVGALKSITLIESPNVPIVGVGEATVPGMPRTLKAVGISERAFFKTCNSSFKLGVEFANWNVDREGRPITYTNAFSRPGTLDGVDIGVYFQELGAKGLEFAQCFSAIPDLIKSCKGPRDASAKDFDNTTGYAYHLDAGRFSKMLSEICIDKGVKHIREDVVDVELDENGYVAALQLSDTGRHPVELVIDCTGFRGLIINKALGEPFVDYSKYLANDRAMAVQIPHADDAQITPVTRSTALSAGWSWRVPLRNRIGTGYVFSSAHKTDEEARDEFLEFLGPAAGEAEPRVIPMRVGRNRRAWVKNCVALGLAGGFIEPLESTAIHMIDIGIRWLIVHFPDRSFPEPLQDGYNRMVNKLYDEVRDFICLHYALSNRTDSQYWIDARTELTVPDSLAENLETWRYRLPSPYDLEFSSLFSAQVYQSVMLGKRIYETEYKRGSLNRGASLDPDLWKSYLGQVLQATQGKMFNAISHRDLIDAIRGEQVPAPEAQAPPFAFGLRPQATVTQTGVKFSAPKDLFAKALSNAAQKAEISDEAPSLL